MKKTIKLTEKDLTRIVNQTIKESKNLNEFFFEDEDSRKRKFQIEVQHILRQDDRSLPSMVNAIMSICQDFE